MHKFDNMNNITLLNIPNFYCSYYLYGLSKVHKIKYVFNEKFQSYNFTPFLIFTIHDKIVVIDNDDPRRVNAVLYELCALYFCTNKLKDSVSYQQSKVRALYPHYPINIMPLYLRLFKLNLFRKLRIRTLATEIYTISRRPSYNQKQVEQKKDNYVFFSGSLWQKEKESNLIRANFIQTCISHPKINFEGGLIHRKDGDKNGLHQSIFNKKYHPRKFSKLTAKSIIGFNNPAVRGAVSWRLAEYLKNGSYILSLPLKTELPKELIHEKHIHFIKDSASIQNVLDRAIQDEPYAKQIAVKGQDYFNEFCTPEAQVDYIVKMIENIAV